MTGTTLLVKPISGKLLKNSKKSNVYLIFKYSKQKFISNYSKNTEKYPFWSETFHFLYNDICDLSVECWEMDNGLVGSGKLESSNPSIIAKNLNWITLKNEEGKMIGELFIEVELKEKLAAKSEPTTSPKETKVEEPIIELPIPKFKKQESTPVKMISGIIQRPNLMRNLSFQKVSSRPFGFNTMMRVNYKNY